ncbi:MAG: FtsX-like permease family protein [Myxococcota bacterium]
MSAFGPGLQSGLAVFGLQLALLAVPSLGTNLQDLAVGGCASLVILLGVGGLLRPRVGAVLVASGFLGVMGLAGVLAGLDGALGMAATVDASLIVPAAALWSGAALRRGLGARSYVVLPTVLGWMSAVMLSIQGARLAFFDQGAITVAVLVAALLAFVLAGALLAVWLRRFPFAEVVLATLLLSVAGELVVAIWPEGLQAALNAPLEQVLIIPAGLLPVVLAAAGTVGASLGFLFHGYGHFEPGLRYELGVALRYLGAHRKSGFFGVISVFAVGGVFLGVLALVVILSVMGGFEGDLKRKILGAHAHVVVHKHGDDFSEYEEVEARLEGLPGVQSRAAFVLGDAMISTDNGLSGSLVKGIDPERAQSIAELAASLQSGRIEHLLRPDEIPGACGKIREPGESCGRVLPGIIIGRELSRILRVYVGDVVKLVSPVSDELGPMGPVPKLERYRVAGVFFSGMYEYDAKFSYISMAQAQSFFGLGPRATGVEIKITELDDTSRIATAVQDVLGGEPYSVRDWRDMNRELFSALLLEKVAMFIALIMIVMVASFLIVATLVMIVLQRGKEIAILKSLGSSDASIMKIFVIQGLLIGVGGALLGVFAGVQLCQLLQTHGIPLDESVFYIQKLPVEVSQVEVLITAIAASTMAYLASIYPAWTAARLTPVEGLRDD